MSYSNNLLLSLIDLFTSQLCKSQGEGPVIPYIYGAGGPSASLPCSYDVITEKVYCLVFVTLSRQAIK